MENTEQIKKTRSKVYRRYNWMSVVLLFQFLGVSVGVILLEIVTLAVKTAVTGDNKPLTADYATFFNGVACIIVNTLVALLVLKISKTGKLRESFAKPSFSAIEVVMTAFMVMGFSYFYSTIVTAFDSVFTSSAKALGQSLGSGLDSQNLVLQIGTMAYLCVLGPITEELLFRGCVLRAGSHISRKVGVIASALLFGLFHGNIAQFFNTFVMGLVLAYVTVKSRSIIPAIIAHICNNSSTIIVMYIKMAVGESNYALVDNVSRVVFITLGIISAVFILRKYKLIDDNADRIPVNLPAAEEEIEQAKTPKNKLKFKTFFSTWAFWIVVAYFIGMSLLIIVMGSKIQ